VKNEALGNVCIFYVHVYMHIGLTFLRVRPFGQKIYIYKNKKALPVFYAGRAEEAIAQRCCFLGWTHV